MLGAIIGGRTSAIVEGEAAIIRQKDCYRWVKGCPDTRFFHHAADQRFAIGTARLSK
jgi:hypothetical protein